MKRTAVVPGSEEGPGVSHMELASSVDLGWSVEATFGEFKRRTRPRTDAMFWPCPEHEYGGKAGHFGAAEWFAIVEKCGIESGGSRCVFIYSDAPEEPTKE